MWWSCLFQSRSHLATGSSRVIGKLNFVSVIGLSSRPIVLEHQTTKSSNFLSIAQQQANLDL